MILSMMCSQVTCNIINIINNNKNNNNNIIIIIIFLSITVVPLLAVLVTTVICCVLLIYLFESCKNHVKRSIIASFMFVVSHLFQYSH